MTTTYPFATIDIEQNCQTSALHAATKYVKVNTIRFLLEKGLCDVNIQDFNGDTPLHLAFKHQYTSVATLLLAYGARNDIKNNFGKTPEFYNNLLWY